MIIFKACMVLVNPLQEKHSLSLQEKTLISVGLKPTLQEFYVNVEKDVKRVEANILC